MASSILSLTLTTFTLNVPPSFNLSRASPNSLLKCYCHPAVTSELMSHCVQSPREWRERVFITTENILEASKNILEAAENVLEATQTSSRQQRTYRESPRGNRNLFKPNKNLFEANKNTLEPTDIFLEPTKNLFNVNKSLLESSTYSYNNLTLQLHVLKILHSSTAAIQL